MGNDILLQEALYEFRLISSTIFPSTYSAMFFGTYIRDTRIGVGHILRFCRRNRISFADYMCNAQQSYRWLSSWGRKNHFWMKRGWLWSSKYAVGALDLAKGYLRSSEYVDYSMSDMEVVAKMRARMEICFEIKLGVGENAKYDIAPLVRDSKTKEAFLGAYQKKLALLRRERC